MSATVRRRARPVTRPSLFRTTSLYRHSLRLHHPSGQGADRQERDQIPPHQRRQAPGLHHRLLRQQERFEEADAAISKLYNAAKGATDTGFNLDTYQLVDHDAYVAEFGCEPRNDGLKLPIVPPPSPAATWNLWKSAPMI